MNARSSWLSSRDSRLLARSSAAYFGSRCPVASLRLTSNFLFAAGFAVAFDREDAFALGGDFTGALAFAFATGLAFAFGATLAFGADLAFAFATGLAFAFAT